MSARPLVSVVIPVHNCERYVRTAIESVLAQSYASVELIVVDDGSTDGTAAILRDLRSVIRAVRQPRAGVAAAANRGVSLARGALLGFLDADDLWLASKLERQVAELSATRAPDCAFGHIEMFVSPELEPAQRAKLICPAGALPGYVRGTMLVRREAFARIGDFDRRWRTGEFIDWYARAKALGLRSVMLDDVVMRRRLHDANSSALDPTVRIDYARIARAALHRARRSAPCR
jgi:glycosyltransferase involved in cell wall biosynthesis